MNQAEKEANKEALWGYILSPFFDGGVLMLALGGLADRFSLPWLAIDYWSAVLIVIVAICILPVTFTTNALLKQILKK